MLGCGLGCTSMSVGVGSRTCLCFGAPVTQNLPLVSFAIEPVMIISMFSCIPPFPANQRQENSCSAEAWLMAQGPTDSVQRAQKRHEPKRDSPKTYLWIAGNEGMEKNMATTIMGLGFKKEWKRTWKLVKWVHMGITVRIHSSIPIQRKKRTKQRQRSGIKSPRIQTRMSAQPTFNSPGGIHALRPYTLNPEPYTPPLTLNPKP